LSFDLAIPLAIDAAIATALMLGVVEPVSTGIGGDAFLLYRWAADGRIYGINGSRRCPRRLTLEELQRRGVNGIPRTGLASVTVPGAIDAFVEAQRRHGKLTVAEVLEPAIHYASEGFPVSEIIAKQWQAAVPLLSQYPSSARTYLIDGKAPLAGEVHRQPNLARTLTLLASDGRDAFYRSEERSRVRSCPCAILEIRNRLQRPSSPLEPEIAALHLLVMPEFLRR
jgi:gamma-glutamyltranspeptidase/glutathione hydrolase